MRLDGDRRIVDVNRAAVRLIGRVREDLIGRPVAEALELRLPNGDVVLSDGWPPSARLPSVRRVPEHVLIATTVGGELALRTTGMYERDADGNVSAAVLAFRPTERAGQRSVSASEVVATVGHELRAPLTAVKGYASLLLNQWHRLSDEQRRLALRHIDEGADRATRLLTELLDVTRLETGRLQLQLAWVDLPELAARVVETVQASYPALRCDVEFPNPFPPVPVDRDKIEQVLTNLIENAAKYAGPEHVRVVGELFEGAVAVSVRDRGVGIPASELPRIFTKFAAADVPHGGIGLGLWICRGLVEAHGGTLTATSVPGQGSVFSFTIPLSVEGDVGP